jgi:hypothetical protein
LTFAKYRCFVWRDSYQRIEIFKKGNSIMEEAQGKPPARSSRGMICALLALPSVALAQAPAGDDDPNGSRHEWTLGKQWNLIVTMDDATNEHYGESLPSDTRRPVSLPLRQGQGESPSLPGRWPGALPWAAQAGELHARKQADHRVATGRLSRPPIPGPGKKTDKSCATELDKSKNS